MVIELHFLSALHKQILDLIQNVIDLLSKLNFFNKNMSFEDSKAFFSYAANYFDEYFLCVADMINEYKK